MADTLQTSKANSNRRDALDPSLEAFRELKPPCVAILGKSQLKISNMKEVSTLLVDLRATVARIVQRQGPLEPKLIEYTIYPISTILNRNHLQDIPDYVLEAALGVISDLADFWWWTIPVSVWTNLLSLAARVLARQDIAGTQDSVQGVRVRSDESLIAAAQLSKALLRPRNDSERPMYHDCPAISRIRELKDDVTSIVKYPLIGQTLNSALDHVMSSTANLRRCSWDLVIILSRDYLSDDRAPAVLPRIASRTCNAVARPAPNAQELGDIVARGLNALVIVIVKSVGDEVCLAADVVRKPVSRLDDLTLVSQPIAPNNDPVSPDGPIDPYATLRTLAWLQATAPQIHICIASLNPLVSHQAVDAQVALVGLAYHLLEHTNLTLPTLQPVLLTYILAFLSSPFPRAAKASSTSLHDLLSSPTSQTILEGLIDLLNQNLVMLPPSILRHSEDRVQTLSTQIISICSLARVPRAIHLSRSIKRLLGQHGGVERWGSRLQGALNFTFHAENLSTRPIPVGFLHDNLTEPSNPSLTFPRLPLEYLSVHMQGLVEQVVRSLGQVGRVEAMFSLDWFFEVGRRGPGSHEIATLWIATLLFEGISGYHLPRVGSAMATLPETEEGTEPSVNQQRLERTAKLFNRSMIELWNYDPEERERAMSDDSWTAASRSALLNASDLQDSQLATEHIKGLIPVVTAFNKGHSFLHVRGEPSTTGSRPTRREIAIMHSALALNVISLTSSVLGTKFRALLLDSIYPILRSLVSSHRFLSETAMATLRHVSGSAGYASPANLLLSNFDYALDSISRRLLRSRLDIKAARVLRILVRLVGHDVVQRAGDVIEECFDRLDELHGYSVVVEGLIDVINEVTGAVAIDNSSNVETSPLRRSFDKGEKLFDTFLIWYKGRMEVENASREDFGSHPRRPWGKAGTEEESVTGGPTDEATPGTPAQALVETILNRSLPMLTHSSPLIRGRVLSIMKSAVSVLPNSQLFVVVGRYWKWIVNRLRDPEPTVSLEATCLVNELISRAGSAMSQRVCADVWPIFRSMLSSLEQGDRFNALSIKHTLVPGTETSYSTSHRFHVAILSSMTSVYDGENEWVQDDLTWEIAVSCRRFLDSRAHPELQRAATTMYKKMGRYNDDLVWLILTNTSGLLDPTELGENQVMQNMGFLREVGLDIRANVEGILAEMM